MQSPVPQAAPPEPHPSPTRVLTFAGLGGAFAYFVIAKRVSALPEFRLMVERAVGGLRCRVGPGMIGRTADGGRRMKRRRLLAFGALALTALALVAAWAFLLP